MYINNLTGKPIKDISFAGYFFSIPAGVSVCWDKFGEFLFNDIYKISGDGGGVSPVVRATAALWKGDRFVDVVRFPINYELIPARKDLFKLAKQRGIDKVTMEMWEEDDNVTNEDIVKAINALDVPEEVKYPKPGADTVDATASAEADAAEDALSGPGAAGATADVPTPPAPAEKAKTAAPSVAGAKTASASKGAKKAAKKAPSTPKPVK